MKQGSKRLLVVVATAVVAAAVLFYFLSEPCYRGHRLTYWVEQLWTAGADQERARTALRAIGPKAVPCLLNKVRFDEAERRRMELWEKLPSVLQEAIPAPEANTRLRQKIPYAISLVGATAVPQLLRGIQDEDRDVRLTSAQAIACLGDRADSATGRLIALLGHTNRGVRANVILAISQMGMSRTQAIPALVLALSDEPYAAAERPVLLRESAARALGGMGSVATSAVPKLTMLLNDPSPTMRLAAASALWQIQRDTNLVYQVMEQLEKPQPIHTYRAFLDLLAQMGTAATPAVPEILRTMTNWGTDMSRSIRRTLSRIDPEAESLAGRDNSLAPERRLPRPRSR
jgi:hypothetical protein